eukprot:scaffold294698_cov31-Prasinocladus_malaysianus.AAC.1
MVNEDATTPKRLQEKNDPRLKWRALPSCLTALISVRYRLAWACVALGVRGYLLALRPFGLWSYY